MSGIKRLTLISDATNEFPNNANNSFKVRLPERLLLPGEGWHASLMSLTVPDQGQSKAIIAADPHTKVVYFKYPQMGRKWTDTGNPSTSGYLRIEWPIVDGMVELEDVMSADQIVATGNMFWKRVTQEVHNKIIANLMKQQVDLMVKERDARPIVFIKKNAMPRFTWKDDSLILHGIPKKDLLNQNQIAMVEFYINLAIALKFGLLRLKTGKTGVNSSDYVLGPNLQFTLPSNTYDETTEPTGNDQRKYYNWEGDVYEGLNYVSRAFTVMTFEECQVDEIAYGIWMAVEQPGCFV